MAFVSTSSYSKLVLRAVNLGDTKMLQKLINDSIHVATVADNVFGAVVAYMNAVISCCYAV